MASLLVVFSAVVVGCGESADSGQTLDSEPIKESPMGTGGTLGTGKVETEPLTLADASRSDNELLDGKSCKRYDNEIKKTTIRSQWDT